MVVLVKMLKRNPIKRKRSMSQCQCEFSFFIVRYFKTLKGINFLCRPEKIEYLKKKLDEFNRNYVIIEPDKEGHIPDPDQISKLQSEIENFSRNSEVVAEAIKW